MNVAKLVKIGFLLVSMTGALHAQETVDTDITAVKSPQKLIQDVTDEVLVAITDAASYYDKDPNQFYAEVERIMTPVMDYQSFARTVMGRYGSSSAYRALKTDAEREQFKGRVIDFTKVFRQTIMNTYGKGLMTFNGERIEVLALNEVDLQKVVSKQSVQVVQVIHSADGGSTKIYYKLKPNRAGEWKLRNVVIDTINLGKVYQSQFASAVKDNEGDIDKAILAWVGP